MGGEFIIALRLAYVRPVPVGRGTAPPRPDCPGRSVCARICEFAMDTVQLALKQDRVRRERNQSQQALRASLASLTQREREILELVAIGLMNKQIAAKMELAEITVKIHRGNMMRKMGARSLTHLLQMAQALGIPAGQA